MPEPNDASIAKGIAGLKQGGALRLRHMLALRFLSALLGGLLSACAGTIPVDGEPPFSSALRDYLDGRPAPSRAQLVRWLGEPDAERLSGTLLIWVGLRELSFDPAILAVPRLTKVDAHYLLVRMDNAGQVVRHDQIVNSGCSTTLSLCIRPGSLPISVTTYETLGSLHADVVKTLTIAAASDSSAPELASGDDRCLVILYVPDKARDVFARPLVTDGDRTYLLTPFTYVQVALADDTALLHWAWSLVSEFRPDRSETLAIRCTRGATRYYALELLHGDLLPLKPIVREVIPDIARPLLAKRYRIITD